MKRVLVVEDNEINQEIMADMLQSIDCRVTVAGDGKEAVERLSKASEEEYDVVLMDIHMPVMDGYEATGKIRNLPSGVKDIPILAMTGEGLAEDRKRATEAGMNGFLTKPVSIDRLKEVMKQVLMIAFAVLCLLVPSVATAMSPENKTLRAGFYYCEGYHEINEDGERTGYGYELLQLIARYKNINYEYVGYDKSCDDMLQLLKEGKIDLVTSGKKLEGREEEFDFSTKNIGFMSTALVIKAGSTAVIAGDYTTYDGLTVGMMKGSSNNDSFEEYAEEKGFTFLPVYYSSLEQLHRALQVEEVDAIVTSNLRNVNADEWLTETFDEEPMYVMVRKGDTETLDMVNDALDRMDRNEEFWRLRLYEKFYQVDTGELLKLSHGEQEYIQRLQEQDKVFRVLVNPDRFPYSYCEDNQMKGIMIDIFDEMAKRAGIRYEMQVVDSYEEYTKRLKNKETDICLDFRDDYFMAEELGYRITSPYLTAEFAWIQRKNYQGDIEKAGRIAYFASAIPDWEKEDVQYFHFNTYTEALAAVRSGMVDAFCAYTFHAEHILWDGGNEDLMATYSFADTKFTIGVSTELENHLTSILNKAVISLDSEMVDSVIRDHTVLGDQPFSLGRFFDQYPFMMILLLLSVCIVVLMAASTMLQRNYHLRLVEAAKKADAANHAKTDFLARMSHDIRTPINGIMGMLDIAEKNTENPDKLQDCLDKMKTASWHLLQLVNDVLDMSKLESGRIELCQESINLEKLLEICVSIIEGQAQEKNLHLEVDIEPMEHPYLIGSELYINQIIVNILGNAVKYTNHGGRVKFHAKETAFDGEKASFSIEVEDNGIGMSAEFLEHIFEPFAQEEISARSTYQGTGLGMTIAKALTELMGGKLLVESTQDVGSKFTVYLSLPVEDKERQQELGSRGEATLGTGIQSVARTASLFATLQTYEREENSYDLAGMKVLLAEDVDLNREIVEYALSEKGVEVTSAADGIEAVEIFKNIPAGTFDVILMDIMMPGLNGLEATKVIRNLQGREDGETIPIVAMTANAYSSDVERSLEAGMNAHLTKPIEMDKLCSVLQQCKLMKETEQEGLLGELALLGVDVQKALYNLSGKEDLYQKLLFKFVNMLNRSEIPAEFEKADVSYVIEQVHSLKGVAGNLALTPLFDTYNLILTALRAGDLKSAKQYMKDITPMEMQIVNCIEKYRTKEAK